MRFYIVCIPKRKLRPFYLFSLVVLYQNLGQLYRRTKSGTIVPTLATLVLRQRYNQAATIRVLLFLCLFVAFRQCTCSVSESRVLDTCEYFNGRKCNVTILSGCIFRGLARNIQPAERRNSCELIRAKRCVKLNTSKFRQDNFFNTSLTHST